jgi:hypothetical protein
MTHRTTIYPYYDVGYGRPPRHSRFQKGQSGNPGGRKRGMTEERAKRLALKEAYRRLKIEDDGAVTAMPAIQAIMRSQVARAAKGNGPAQRAVIKVVQEIERELAAIAAARAEEERRKKPMSDTETVRRIAFLLDLGGWVDGEPIPKRSEVGAAEKAANEAAEQAAADGRSPDQAAAETQSPDQAVSGSKPADEAAAENKPSDSAVSKTTAADQAVRKRKAAVKAPTESKR